MDWTEVWDKIGDGINTTVEGLNRGLLRLFGSSNERQVRRMHPMVEAVGALEPRMQPLSDEELRDQTRIFRERLAAGETLDDLQVEAFAACREAGRRFLKMRHYDVQLLGGAVLHQGKIAEMVTGEGKTLVATLAAYLNALEGKGVHVVTVNDYLARRDAEWMTPLYAGLGLRVGAIQSSMDPHERKPHYDCDITYGTNNEFGFDYLRDNMKPTRELQAQGTLNYAIIDEVDSILIDEARTPLIISGPALDDPMKYAHANRIAKQLKRDVHFEVKEKEHTCHLTDAGILEAEKLVGVESFYSAGNMEWPHLIDNALKANHLYHRDKEYMVRGSEVIIVDEHTGRAMEGRQWSDGLHQAVEAKEGVTIKQETQTLATITFQNFFKLYSKIAGMTGTAMTEADEFLKIYKLDVMAIPTNVQLQRRNYPDVIYCTQKEKWKAVVEEVKITNRTGRPVLVGTTSVEKSEYLSDLFRRNGIKHEMLNAKFVEREADIVAQAGRRGAVTISTNMAGRGTDIILGGNPEQKAWAELKERYPSRLEIPPDVWRDTVAPFAEPMSKEGREVATPRSTVELARDLKVDDPQRWAQIVDEATLREREDPAALAAKHELEDADKLLELIRLRRAAHPGGLHIVGTERHEARRIDNQLRGRAGRQGDPGSSRFFLSLDDDLMRIFAGEWVRSILQRLGMKEGEAIESRMVSRRIAGAQKKVEERNFDTRKHLLEYDEIMDVQRKRVYGFRQAILEGANCKELILEMIDRQVDRAVADILGREYGPASFAAWATARLGAEFEEKEFYRCDFEQAVELAKDEAMRQAESAIIDVVDENLDEEVDQRQWGWEALANWANARWNLKLKAYDLKRIGRDGVGQHLYEHACKCIEQVHLEGGREFFNPDFGCRMLLAWARQKLTLEITSEELPSLAEGGPGPIADFLKTRARELYARKEVEFPVFCGLTRFMHDSSAAGAGRYDRDGLVRWASRRFEVELDPNDYKNLTRRNVIDRLVGFSQQFFGEGSFQEEIDGQLGNHFHQSNGTEETTVAAERLTDLSAWAENRFGKPLELPKPLMQREEIRTQLLRAAEARYRPELREAERALLLQFLDMGWKDHLYAMDHLRSGIGLVGYAQVDPKVEYKRKGKLLFEEMWTSLDNKVTDLIFRVEQADSNFVSSIWHVSNVVHEQAPVASADTGGGSGIREQQEAAMESTHGEQRREPIRRKNKKIGRNASCPCGSGKKYKNCCMKKGAR